MAIVLGPLSLSLSPYVEMPYKIKERESDVGSIILNMCQNVRASMARPVRPDQVASHLPRRRVRTGAPCLPRVRGMDGRTSPAPMTALSGPGMKVAAAVSIFRHRSTHSGRPAPFFPFVSLTTAGRSANLLDEFKRPGGPMWSPPSSRCGKIPADGGHRNAPPNRPWNPLPR